MPVDATHLRARQRDPGSSIAEQIQALAGGRVRVILERERPWASITFTGTRHSFVIERTDATAPDDMDNLARALPEHEFAMRAYFLADILVTNQSESRLLVEALSIIDPVTSGRD